MARAPRRPMGPAIEAGLPAAAVLAGAGAWEMLGRTLGLPAIPPLSTVLSATWTLLLQGDLLVLGDSMRHLVIGVGMSLAGGLATGAVLVMSKRLQYLLLPYLNAAMALPMVAFVPIFILVFGFRSGPRLATIIAFSYFSVVVNTFAGARAVDAELLEMAQAMGCSTLRSFFSIRVPAALPLIMEGVTLGVGRGIIGMVTGEYLVTTTGIGGLLLTFAQNYRLPELYGGVLVVLAFSVTVYLALRGLEARVTAWSTGSLR